MNRQRVRAREGVIKFWYRKKGYGFIIDRETSEEFFLLDRNLIRTHESVLLGVGVRVIFLPDSREGRPLRLARKVEVRQSLAASASAVLAGGSNVYLPA